MNRRVFLKFSSIFGVTSLFGLRLPQSAEAATTICSLSKLPIGGNFEFTSKTGIPAIVFRTKKGVYAYSLKCTHAGCKCGLSSGALVCPCHGSKFDPANGGKVLAGPATTALPKIKVSISGKNVVEA